ncbi:MAG: SH3 domain-containing protein [Gammaproteobacteria bacterium]|nr:SH3 domain-containing protein [Gammaproteobacteria bacterium]
MNPAKNLLASLLLFILLIFSYSAIARDAVTVRTANLKESASVNSTTIKELKKNQPLTVILRKGSWYEVNVPSSSGEIKGWVRMIDLRFNEAVQNASGQSSVSLLGSVFGEQSSHTVGTGVRGLDNEDIVNTGSNTNIMGLGVISEDKKLENSTMNMNAVKDMEKFSISHDKARFFAEQGQLRSQAIILTDSK